MKYAQADSVVSPAGLGHVRIVESDLVTQKTRYLVDLTKGGWRWYDEEQLMDPPPPHFGWPDVSPPECAAPTPSEAAKRKARPLARGCFAYFPDFLASLSQEMGSGEFTEPEPEHELFGLVVEAHTNDSPACKLALTLLYELQRHLVPGKCIDLSSGLLCAFGDALSEVAAVSLAGSEQHHPGKPLHWEADKSTDHADCLARHYVDHCKGQHVDTDGQLHLAKACWRSFALGQTAMEARGPELKALRTAQRLAAGQGKGIPA